MSTEQPTIVFFGTPDFAVASLEALLSAGYSVAQVVTAPDKPTGRKQVLTPPPVKVAAEQKGIPVLQPKTLKDDVFFEQFSGLKPELCVVVAYGKIVPEKYLALPELGFVNVHPSLLPAYRGPSPIQTAILDGCASTGVSIMMLDKGVDHGPVLASENFKIESEKFYLEIRDELAALGAKLLIETIPKYLSGELAPQEQDHELATFTKMLTRHDGRLDWSKPARVLYNQVRALNPEPGTWTVWKGKQFNILRAHLESDSLVPDVVQIQGGKPMLLADFINGHPDFRASELE